MSFLYVLTAGMADLGDDRSGGKGIVSAELGGRGSGILGEI